MRLTLENLQQFSISITKTCPCNIQTFFSADIEKSNFNIFNIFDKKIDCGYTLEPPWRTHNLCFGSKIRKIGIPL